MGGDLSVGGGLISGWGSYKWEGGGGELITGILWYHYYQDVTWLFVSIHSSRLHKDHLTDTKGLLRGTKHEFPAGISKVAGDLKNTANKQPDCC